MAGELAAAGPAADQRLARLALARPLLPDDAPRLAAAGARGPRGARALSRSSARSRSTASRCAASPRTRCSRSRELARRKPYQVRFIEFMPLDADHAWSEDRVLTGAEIRAMIDAVYPLEPLAARAARDRARSTASATASGEIGFVNPVSEPFCARLQPHPPDRRGQAAHLPLQPARDRPARAAARRRRRRRARGDDPRRGLAQGAQAPRLRARLPPAAAHDEPDRRLDATEPDRPEPRTRPARSGDVRARLRPTSAPLAALLPLLVAEPRGAGPLRRDPADRPASRAASPSASTRSRRRSSSASTACTTSRT